MTLRTRLALIAATSLSFAACASEKPAAAPAEEAPPPTLFAVRFNPGPKWVVGKPPMEQPAIGEHVTSFEGLVNAGRCCCCGPFLDGTGGLAILTVASMDEAKAIAAADPAVKAGTLVPEIHPWMMALCAKDCCAAPKK